MPELPEVETICVYLRPHLLFKHIRKVVIRENRLRYRVQRNLPQLLQGRKILSLERRAKYIIMNFSHGKLLIHLGMSGTLRLIDKERPVQKHDHIDITAENKLIRYNDPRRFGCFVWEKKNQEKSLLNNLGYEPLENEFNGNSLYKMSLKSTLPIKSLLMTNHYLTGVGNIYAAESLWLARISPFRKANEMSREECALLAQSIKKLLRKAVRAGGTSIRDYQGADGTPGYFLMQLNVYGKNECPSCNSPVKRQLLGQRSTFFCPVCQE